LALKVTWPDRGQRPRSGQVTESDKSIIREQYDMLWEQNNISREPDNMLWEQNSMLWEKHIFLVGTK